MTTVSTFAELEREADARWERLTNLLDERTGVTLHGPGSNWEARDEYAHLARWIDVATERLRAATEGRPFASPEPDPNLRWQSEDRALSLKEASERCSTARDGLVAVARALPADARAEGLLAIAAGELVAHLDEHLMFVVGGMLAEDVAAWAELTARLDAAPAGVLHEGGGFAWEARDVYAHLARWLAFAADSIEAFLDGGVPLANPGKADDLNGPWFAEDRALTLDVARGRAAGQRDRLRELAQRIPVERWTGPLYARMDYNTAAHYREHLGYFAAT